MKHLLALVAFTATLSLAGCVTDRGQSQLDWDALFAEYGSGPEKSSAERRAEIESIFSFETEKTARKANAALRDRKTDRETFAGAADAAGYLKAKACLAELENQLRSSEDWYRRFACANAIDSIDESSSAQTVISALYPEQNGMVAMALAMYLTRHPAPGTESLLELKCREFEKKGDDSSVIATLFLEDALAALKNQN